MGEILERRLKSGQRVYYARYYENGKRHQVATKQPTEKKAQNFLDEIESRIRKGMVGIVRPTKEDKRQMTITVGELFERFVTEYDDPDLHDPEDYRNEARSNFKTRIRPHLAHRPAADVTRQEVDRLRSKLLDEEGYAKRSVIGTLALISKMFNWASDEGIIRSHNPAKGVKRPRLLDEDKEIDFFSQGEVERLLAHAEEHAPRLFPLIAFCVFTGARKGEAFGLTWGNVILDGLKKIVRIRRSYEGTTKSGRPREVPIHPALEPILRRWRGRDDVPADQLVFPMNGAMGRGGKLYGLDALLKAAGCHVPKKPWHALRHTFASHYLMSGGSLYALKELLGHAHLETTEIYGHLAPDYKTQQVALLNFSRPTGDVLDIDEARRERDTNGHLVRSKKEEAIG